MKPLTDPSWIHLERLPGDTWGDDGSWRKRVRFDGRDILLTQQGFWCGVKCRAFALETPEEVAGWTTLDISG
ncbi:MAG: hypothetical protein HQL82_16365 [Magnetococcales bacterium]|nr:hypothetical protein [Magnetococcales bacterium]